MKPWAGEFPSEEPERCEDCGSLDEVEYVTYDDGASRLVCRRCLDAEAAK